MSSFTTPAIIKTLSKNEVSLFTAFTFYRDPVDEAKQVMRTIDKIIVPAGFIGKYTFIPKVLWSFIPPDTAITKANLLLDFLLKDKEVSRKEADSIYKEALQVLGVGAIKICILYLVAKLFGRKTKS